MHKNDKLVFLIGSTIVAVTSHKFFRFRKEQSEMRQQAATNLAAEFAAIRSGYTKVAEDINRGKYRDKSFDDIETDFQFHIIAAHEEQ